MADDGGAADGLNLGVLVAVGGGDILLLFARCAHGAQCGPPSTQMLRSSDDGRSWGPPLNISGQVGTEVFAPGPGYGIQVWGGARKYGGGGSWGGYGGL